MTQALSDNSTVFHQLLSPICRTDFERLASQNHQGQRLRSTSRWDQFIAMLLSQLYCRQSLRDIQSNLDVQQAKLRQFDALLNSFITLKTYKSFYAQLQQRQYVVE